jgi:hypothetical protein
MRLPDARGPRPIACCRAGTARHAPIGRTTHPSRRRIPDNGGYLGGEVGTDPLVGVDFEHPVTAARRDPGVAPLPFALPGALDDPIGKASGDLGRSIVAAVEHDDDLVGEAEAGQAVGKLPFFVARDDKGGKRRAKRRGEGGLRRCDFGDAHAASLAARCQRRIAAASTESTERVSISVSVVR